MARKRKRRPKSTFGKIWYFIWEDDSLLSWIINIILAFILIKFIVYPVMGFALGTNYPIVAVVSGSMEHDGSYKQWWNQNADIYDSLNITEDEFRQFPFSNGFNTGDIMLLRGKKIDDIKVGDILVYWGSKSDPIIHRVVHINRDGTYMTKGDHNLGSNPDEISIVKERIVGYDKYSKGSVAFLRIPYVGYLKIFFVKLIGLFAR